MTDNVSQDFVFGTLATDELRLAQMRAARAGVSHAHRLAADPQPGELVAIQVSLGPQVAADHVTCYYTTDGGEPYGERGIVANGQAIELVRSEVVWDTLLWGYLKYGRGDTGPAAGDTGPLPDRGLGRATGRFALGQRDRGRGARRAPASLEPYDEQLFAVPGQEPLWPLRRMGSYAYHVDQERVPG